MSKVADVLERAADRLEKPGAWTQRANARNGDGLPTASSSDDAVCWCMAGAIFAETKVSSDVTPYTALCNFLPEARSGKDRIVAFNDAPERTQAEVVAKLREAAAVAREQGK